MSQPKPDEYTPYFQRYIDLVPWEHGSEALHQTGLDTVAFLHTIPPAKSTYRYAPEKWTVNQVLGHIIDTERIFQYRVLRILREEQAEMAGFDQDVFVKTYPGEHHSLADLIREFEDVRTSSRWLFHGLAEEDWKRMGKADGKNLSVRAAAFIISGHTLHHRQVLETRYL